MKEFFADLGEGIKSVFKGPSNKENLFSLDNRVPLKNALPFAVQHILIMLASNIAPLFIVFSAIGLFNSDFAIHAMLAAIFMAGIGTIIQLLIGSRLPIVIGSSFTFVPILITIGLGAGGGEDAFYTIVGSLIAGGLFAVVFSLFYRFWGKLIKPIVPAMVVLGLGLSLLSSGALSFFGGNSVVSSIIETGQTPSHVPYFCYIIVAFVTFLSALIWSLLFKGMWKNVNIVVGIVVGFIVSCCIPGMVDFSKLAIDSSALIGPHGIIDFPRFINLTKIKFSLVPCILTAICYIVITIETIGTTSVLVSSTLERKATSRELFGALVGNNFSSLFASLFGTLPLISYAQNVGIVVQSKAVNRYTIFIGAAFLVIAGFFPPVANLIFAIPDVVIGGAMVILFGSICVLGMKSISEIGWSDKNILITAISVCLGFGITIANVTLTTGQMVMATDLFANIGIPWLGDLLSNNILNMFIIAFILSWVLPESMHISLFHKQKEK